MVSKLKQIAARMRAAVAGLPLGWTQKTLPDGLDLVLSHNGEKWRLALRRENVYPSETEAQILAGVFDVPEGTDPLRRQTCDAAPVTQRRRRWQIIEFNWIEAESIGARPD